MGKLDKADRSSWYEGTAALSDFRARNIVVNNKSLQKLGDPNVIIRHMDVLLTRTIRRRGGLPTIRAVPIRGCPTPLLLPTEGLSEVAVLQFEQAASQGLEQLQFVVSEIEGELERAERTEEAEGEEGDGLAPNAYVTSASALATTLSSLADAAVNTQNEVPSAQNVRVAVSVLNTVAAACDLAGSLVSDPIAGIVLVVVAWLCRIVGWIIQGLKGYFIDSNEGVNREWSVKDRRLILSEKLRILCQCDEKALTNENWTRVLTEQGLFDTDSQEDFFGGLLQQVSDYPQGGDKTSNSVQICMAIGGMAESFRLITQIQEWMMYAGASPNEAKLIHDWLYGARQLSVILDRQKFLAGEGNNETHVTGGRRWFKPSMKGDSWKDDIQENCERANLAVGCKDYWNYCKHLPPDTYVDFSLNDLRKVHHWLQERLQVQVEGYVRSGQKSSTKVAKSANLIALEALQREPGGMILDPRGAKLFYFDVIGADGKILFDPAVLAKEGLLLDQVKTDFRKNYVSVLVRDKYYGCLIGIRANRPLWQEGSAQDAIVKYLESDESAEWRKAVVEAYNEKFGGVTPSGVEYPDPVKFDRMTGLQLIGWSVSPDEQRIINSTTFKTLLAQEIERQFPVRSSSSSLWVGLGAAGALGLGLWAILRK